MSQYEYRKFQAEASVALLRDIEEYHPLVAIPTGAGKTIVLTRFIYLYLEKHPMARILIVSHTENILRQDYKTITDVFQGIKIGLFSSGLKSKTIEKITVAGIQSIYRKPKLFFNTDVVIVDEAHLVQRKSKSMYWKLFANIKPSHKRLGLSATVFRKRSGYLHEGEGRMFDKLSYDLSSADNFTKLIDDGYLCNMISKGTNLELDIAGIKTTAGDYNQKQLSEKFDRTTITNAAVDEIIKYGANYKSWLIFAIDIKHADHIAARLNDQGIKTLSLHTKSRVDRHSAARVFKMQKIRALVSVGMITTGFDAPNVDLIGMLRPTKSPVLHIQTAGRGTRPHPGKDHCLFLDFAGNTMRLGPINNVKVRKRGEKGKGNPPAKKCPKCQCVHHIAAKFCDVCGHKFKFEQKITIKPWEQDVIKRKKVEPQWMKVDKINYIIHHKRSSEDSLRVIYQCGIMQINEYICLNHGGYARLVAVNWVKHRWQGSGIPPNDVIGLFNFSHYLKTPSEILIEKSGRYNNIKNVRF